MNTYTPTRPAHLQMPDVRDANHPARLEINRCLGVYDLKAIVEEDLQTSALMKHMPGLISIVCTLKLKDKVIAQGYGSSVLNQNNRYINRAVHMAVNSAVADSVIRATKVLGTLQDEVDAMVATPMPSEPITEPQKKYLRELALQQMDDEDEREQFLSELPELTKQEASMRIQQLKS